MARLPPIAFVAGASSLLLLLLILAHATTTFGDESVGYRNVVRHDDEDYDGSGERKERDVSNLLLHALLSLLCVTCAAIAAGLTLGMLSLDPVYLEIKRRSSDVGSLERQRSELLLPLIASQKRRHRLLVSLLLLNSLANEALPLFLDELLPNKYVAIIVSVTFVLFFGEIIPSAVFTGPDQVRMAASLVPLARSIMFVLSPIAVPIAGLLDRVLHEGGGREEGEGDITEGNHYNRNELSALVRIQYESQLAAKRRRKVENERMLLRKSLNTWGETMGGRRDGGESSDDARRDIDATIIERVNNTTIERNPNPTMHHDEITIDEGALKLKTKFAVDVCTPLNRVHALPSDTILDERAKVDLLARGHSRVPVYHRRPPPAVAVAAAAADDWVGPTYPEEEDISGIIGVLLVRQLIVVDSSESRPISTMELRRPSCIPPDMHLVDVINLFQASGGRGNGGLHLAVVCMRPDMAAISLERGEPIPPEAGVVGIITLEDVVEELLQEEIYDEADRDLEFSRRAVRKWRDFVRRRRRKTKISGEGGQFTVSFADDMTTEATPLLE
ncbi:hypothetical protein ACHAXA_000629 [Cyclostephanos tholiformis]|uniref:CNNM transmembrane domain-containing protein n=1 Tax=Cyclostephanos tholiformis TaxID=382380 RepID=A0ABD3SRA1_9STRA